MAILYVWMGSREHLELWTRYVAHCYLVPRHTSTHAHLLCMPIDQSRSSTRVESSSRVRGQICRRCYRTSLPLFNFHFHNFSSLTFWNRNKQSSASGSQAGVSSPTSLLSHLLTFFQFFSHTGCKPHLPSHPFIITHSSLNPY